MNLKVEIILSKITKTNNLRVFSSGFLPPQE